MWCVCSLKFRGVKGLIPKMVCGVCSLKFRGWKGLIPKMRMRYPIQNLRRFAILQVVFLEAWYLMTCDLKPPKKLLVLNKQPLGYRKVSRLTARLLRKTRCGPAQPKMNMA